MCREGGPRGGAAAGEAGGRRSGSASRRRGRSLPLGRGRRRGNSGDVRHLPECLDSRPAFLSRGSWIQSPPPSQHPTFSGTPRRKLTSERPHRLELVRDPGGYGCVIERGGQSGCRLRLGRRIRQDAERKGIEGHSEKAALAPPGTGVMGAGPRTRAPALPTHSRTHLST
jgi:hypothetical protein